MKKQDAGCAWVALLVAILFVAPQGEASSTVAPAPINLRVEHLAPNKEAGELAVAGIDVLEPRFYWQLPSEEIRGHKQEAYRLVIEKRDTVSSKYSSICDSGLVNSDRSAHVRCSGEDKKDLESSSYYKWRVMIWDNHGRKSAWAESYFVTGLLSPSAEVIECAHLEL